MSRFDERRLVKFMADYEARVNHALADDPTVDVDGTAGVFMRCFIAASPNEVVCNQNDDAFRAAIPRGFEFYRRIGTKAMKIASMQMTPLDDCHAMAKVRWRSTYEPSDGVPLTIDFDIIYLFHLAGEKPQIFCYIAGDEEKMLRDHGLLAA